MAKFISDTVMDTLLQKIIDDVENGDVGGQMSLTIGQPTSVSSNVLQGATDAATTTMTAATGFGSLATDGGNGRRVAVDQQSGIAINGAPPYNTCDHVALWNSTTNTLSLVTTLTTSRSLLVGDTVNFNAFNIDTTYTP